MSIAVTVNGEVAVYKFNISIKIENVGLEIIIMKKLGGLKQYSVFSMQSNHSNMMKGFKRSLGFKVSGPFVETSCVFQCIENIINAEMWA